MLEKQFPEKIMLSRECIEFSVCACVCVCALVVNKTDKSILKETQAGGRGGIGPIEGKSKKEEKKINCPCIYISKLLCHYITCISLMTNA